MTGNNVYGVHAKKNLSTRNGKNKSTKMEQGKHAEERFHFIRLNAVLIIIY